MYYQKQLSLRQIVILLYENALVSKFLLLHSHRFSYNQHLGDGESYRKNSGKSDGESGNLNTPNAGYSSNYRGVIVHLMQPPKCIRSPAFCNIS
jgi:hypothetical protein